MEVKMNKEIRDYQESMFWGLSFRQCLFSVLAILAALGIYFLTRKYAGEQVTGWLCVLGAAPFAACGFFRYHGMTAEQFAWAVIKSELLYPKRLVFKSENLYFSCMEESLRLGEKMMGNGAELLEKKRTKQKKPKKPGGRVMPLIKTLSQTLKQDKEKFKVPRSVQQAIPIRKIWPDGIFQVESKYSRTFRFTDINYSIASKADKTEMFLDYSELLNALDSGCTAKITLNNRKINKEEFEQSLLIPMKGDGLDEYRKEYNDMLLSKISGTNNSIYQERYLTVSVHKKNIDEARTYFARVGTDIITHLAKLSSIGEELDAEQRLQIFRDFFKADVPQSFPFDMKAFAKKGHSFKDWICPDTMEFHNDHFKLGEQYGRVLFMEDYASYVKDEMISELCSLAGI